jgi:hypothetical protein
MARAQFRCRGSREATVIESAVRRRTATSLRRALQQQA